MCTCWQGLWLDQINKIFKEPFDVISRYINDHLKEYDAINNSKPQRYQREYIALGCYVDNGYIIVKKATEILIY